MCLLDGIFDFHFHSVFAQPIDVLQEYADEDERDAMNEFAKQSVSILRNLLNHEPSNVLLTYVLTPGLRVCLQDANNSQNVVSFLSKLTMSTLDPCLIWNDDIRMFVGFFF